jgi:hypothetical protein
MLRKNIETSLRNIVCWNEIEDGIGQRKAKRFLQELIINYCEENFEYYDETGEFAFSYSEKVAMTHIITATRKMTKALLAELPYKAKGDNQRFIDLWCRYEDIEYFIEVKHGWNNSKTKQITSDIKNLYEICLEQIKDFKIRQLDKTFDKISNHRYKVAIMIMPDWISEKNADKLSSTELHQKYEKDLWQGLHKKVNFAGMCRIKDEFAVSGNAKYSLLTLFGWIEKID